MDATCAIQASIHVFSLVRKYVSRILGTYQWGGGFLFRPLFVCKSSHVSRETSHTLNAAAPWLAFLPFSDISLPSPSLFQYTVDSDTYLNPAA